MKPLKSLKPSMREKKRYLLVSGRNLKENVEKAIFDFIGILGMSKAGLEWIKTGTDSAIIAVNRKSVEHVRASFAVFPEKIEVRRVSGTLKRLGR
jgi:RNase P/RNase MRP subunit POP5